MRKLFDDLWNRVIVNYVPTLVAFGCAVGLWASDQALAWSHTLNLPDWAVNLIAAVIALAGAYFRSKSATEEFKAKQA